VELTKHYMKVFEYLLKVPEGKVTTYGDLAKLANINTPRLVGKILHNNPDEKKYPCHRVIRSNRTLADGFAFGGKDEQMAMLEAEGVEFDGGGRVKKEFLI
jgi:methylated-DNA-protein-cysteine methyltransferase-like protein